jgi:DNA polymerase-1
MKKKLLAIDGNSILNRAFYGVRPLTTKEGFPTNALYGTVNMISRQFQALSPDYCAVAFDLKAPTFRHKMYDAYKAGRRPMPEELALQMPVAKELLRTMGYTILELEGYEADDILGTLSAMCEAEDAEAYLMTGDKDSLQLIGANTKVLLATNSDTVMMDEKAFFERYGVKSSQFVDVKALMGDSSDNIPGVPGIGEKTALKLIAEFGSLDGVYENLPTAKHTPSVRSKLEAGKESAYLSRELATINRQVPLGVTLPDIATREIDRESLKSQFLRLEFSAFLKRFDLDREENPSLGKQEYGETIGVVESMLASFWEKDDAAAIDFEEDNILLASKKTCGYYKGDLSALLSVLQSKTVVCYDSKALYKRAELSALRSCKLFDLTLAAYLVNSSKSNQTVVTMIGDYLGEILPETAKPIFYYHRLYDELSKRLDDCGQKELYDRIEMPLALVLADMEIAGFKIDRDGIAHYGEQLQNLAQALESQIYMQTGKVFNINSPKQLGEVLFEDLGLPHGKKTKTGYSTNAEILEKLRPYHAVISDILDYRQVTKLKSTYADGLLKVADENGIIHSNFKQTGTATGRLSSTDPNLQNIPVRTELGKELRRFFLPQSNDYVIIDADYSQIELRLLAHISGDDALIDAFVSGADIHTSTAATVFGVDRDSVTSEMRKKAKAVNFGILYGIGAFSLSDDIGVSVAQAKEYIDQYLAGYPKIDLYLKNIIQSAYDTGYVKTLFGRVRYIPELSGKNKVQQKFGERVAMNSPIQGTAADLIKIAMIRVHDRLLREGLDARLILQVHDELLVEASRDCAERAKEILREEMEGAAKLSVPLTVEIHIGENWYDAK